MICYCLVVVAAIEANILLILLIALQMEIITQSVEFERIALIGDQNV